ncbi:MAG: myo-inosose-2 dehydratase [Alicyclobacillus sp.]|nr:myo-inosose-2 dehydratase [Alicyclobacillus sp.]
MDDLGDFYELETVLRDMQSLGFRGTELGRKFPRDPRVLRPLLERFGLVLSGAWKTVQFSSGVNPEEDLAGFRRHVDFLRDMGAGFVIACDGGGSLHWDARGPSRVVVKYDEPAWRRLAEGLNRAGEYAAQRGVQLVYHPHLGTGVETPEEIDSLMARTDAGLVSLLVDTGHIWAAGGDPAAVIRRHGPRVRYVHLKDVRQQVRDEMRGTGSTFLEAVRKGLFTTPGDGSVDFPSVFAALRDAGYDGWMILEAEQDPTVADPVVYAQRSLEYLERVTEMTGTGDLWR